MKALYKLKDMLCQELEEYGERKQLDQNSLEIVDTLAHALKNIDKVIEEKEMENYSEARGGSSRGSIQDGMGNYAWPQYTRFSNESSRGSSRRSYRGSMASSRYSREGSSREGSSRDGYSGNDQMIEELERLMEEAPDEKTRKEIERLVQKMESM